jgi:plastocyanin
MFRLRLAPALLTTIVIGCSDSNTTPTVPASSSRNSALALTADRAGAKDSRTVSMYDSCDPATFNAVFNDPTICIKQGHVPFDRFIAELTNTQQAAQWRFEPRNIEVDRGEDVFALNKGGEVHTFTRVAQFGGGILPLLNNLSGNPTPAAECTTLEADDFVAPDATYTAELNTDAVQHFQCCIHPWMRADVHIKHS